ncbi:MULTISPECIES: CGNR zinc finger domain-containing protein [unclassified Marinomonas]
MKRRSNEKCILMFVDTSRTKRRPWCNMESGGFLSGKNNRNDQ